MPRILLTKEQKLATKRESNRRWAEANREKMTASRHKYAAANKEKEAARKAKARKENPALFKARKDKWVAENPEKVREWRKKHCKKASVIAATKAWRAANVEKVKASSAASAKRRRPFTLEHQRRRYAENVEVRLACLLRNRMKKAVKRGARTSSVIAALGCSVPDLIAYLEAQFKDAMTWSNHGEWHIDHIRPVSSFDLTDPAQFLQACHFSNLQPLWRRENQTKGSRFTGNDARGRECRLD